MMNREAIIQAVDHTLLSQTAAWEDIRQLCDDAAAYHTASVCIPPSYVKQASQYLKGVIPVCTVIGFPNGYNTTKVKVFETREAIADGADEIDMVINLGWLKNKNYQALEHEIKAVKEACQDNILKVIIETCLLTEAEKIKMCEIVTSSGADFIKTSTGFSTNGATFEDMKLFASHVGPGVGMKAAGGIQSFEDGEKFMKLGASRLGTSRIIKLAKCEDAGNSY